MHAQRAEQCTFEAPQGQVFGRAGRRSTLENGERALDWCIKVRSVLQAEQHDLQPQHAPASVTPQHAVVLLQEDPRDVRHRL